ncbi:MAG: porin, partial [Azonexus sp.]
FGVAKLQAAYQRAKLEQAGGDLKNNRWILSATVPVTAKIGVIGEYAQAKLDQGAGNSDDKNKAYTLAATYSLSKRTTAYAAFVAVRPDAKDSDVNIYGAGLRHAF